MAFHHQAAFGGSHQTSVWLEQQKKGVFGTLYHLAFKDDVPEGGSAEESNPMLPRGGGTRARSPQAAVAAVVQGFLMCGLFIYLAVFIGVSVS